MMVLAASTGTQAAEGLLPLAFLFVAGYVMLWFFFRRKGGKGGGSEKASVGAWILFAAIIVGILVATR